MGGPRWGLTCLRVCVFEMEGPPWMEVWREVRRDNERYLWIKSGAEEGERFLLFHDQLRLCENEIR